MSPILEVRPDKKFQENLDEVINFLGYGAPFDAEQRAINNMLLEKRAGKIACTVAWGYYHDYKIAEARNKHTNLNDTTSLQKTSILRH